jgi:pimeloyl-ACP methyl ester carboxylesterase
VITTGPENAFSMVLLHGGYASSTMWFANIADLSAVYRVYAIDTFGEPGMSIPKRPNASRAFCANWLVEVLEELKIRKAHVVGLSRGGWLAMNLALHAPQLLERVVLLSPAASYVVLPIPGLGCDPHPGEGAFEGGSLLVGQPRICDQ